MSRRPKLNPGKPLDVDLTPADLARLFAGYTVDSETGCWLWQGYCDRKGYGQIKIQGKARWTHRVTFAVLKHPAIGGRDIDHDRSKCSNKRCGNPEHMRDLTRSDNSSEAARYRNRRRSRPPPLPQKPDDGIPF